MKLSSETMNILKSFSMINNSMWIKEGKILSVISSAKSVLAITEIEEFFPVSFGVYDMKNLLSVLALHKDNPDLEFDEHHLLIKGMGGKSTTKYRFTDRSMITRVPPEKGINMPSEEIEFLLEEDFYIWIVNTSKVLQSTHISVFNDGSTGTFLKAYCAKDDSAHQEVLEILGPDDSVPTEFNMVFNTTNFNQIIPGSYNVKISEKRISLFQHTEKNLKYYIALEEISTYNN